MTYPEGGSNRFAVRVPSEASYEVHVAPGLLADVGRRHVERFRLSGLPEEREVPEAGFARPFVLTDARVGALHGAALKAAFSAVGPPPAFLTVPEGETSKQLATFERLISELDRLGADRRAVLYCFGGGMVSDLGGFVASAYMRGIRYVNVATSLIGQLDAAVGGKVAVNTPVAKNLVGAFHHPSLVLCDPALLATLSPRDFRSGIAEAIKVAIIASPALFAFLSSRRDALVARDPAALSTLVLEAARLKMELVGIDPYERDLSRPLNFGHTVGHALESAFAYRGLRHGEAVAVGMAIATELARRRRLLAAGVAAEILALLRRFDLADLVDDFPAERVAEHFRTIRQIRGGHLHFVLPVAIGRVEFSDDVATSELREAFLAARESMHVGKVGMVSRAAGAA
jgi:3-dehydroquinate synthase